MKSICVFCGSSKGSHQKYMELARQVGEYFANKGVRVVYGGASIGLMGAVADGALAAGGEVVGVIPKVILELEIAHEELTELITVNDMLERKQKMFEISDAFLALPGGFGTLDEVFEALTWTQLKLQDKPMYILNSEGFFDATASQIGHMVQEGFVSKEHSELCRFISSCDEI